MLEYLQFACIRAFANTSLHVKRSAWLSPQTQPNRIKSYPCRPNLYSCRIFTPPNHSEQGQTILPLVISVHGGGFIVNAPAFDDPMARHIADHANCIVVSIDYGKSPQSKFPGAYDDVMEQSLAIIDDPELPIDKSKVVLCGSSAGGNLVLAVAQDPKLRPKLRGVAAIYPLVDMTEDAKTKMATRPDSSVPDFVGDSLDTIYGLYFDAAEKSKLSLKDVRISPTYFSSRESLPQEILLIGAEHDMVCHEDEIMADKLAAASADKKVATKNGWKAPGVEWYKVHGQKHAFNAFPEKDPDVEKVRVRETDAMFSSISEWLVDTFANNRET
ncbi:alpha beta-hydrolase [Lecanosticta acicola]|uniref:Alpha beta-hydrolase n=1 Tax=Lecanosticta acicola TaxID=111012 RepID=A0AAI8Z8L6_9PEZI|nr:alpha beta-hydrolase [Lecanosticta acicola]